MSVIPDVLIADLLWAFIAACLFAASQSKATRRLTGALVVYVLVEAFCHVPMEMAAASVMGWLS